MINIIGLGYIGLPTALMFASHGCEVVGTDYNPQLIATLNAGHASFEEKGLDVMRRHAADFVRQKLAPAEPANDGRQTPMHGHPVFKQGVRPRV